MRLLQRLLGQPLPGRPALIKVQDIGKRFQKPPKNFVDVLKNKGAYWLMIPGFFLSHHLQYVNDIHMVNMVRYKVKLYPEKPVRPRFAWQH